MREPWYRGWKEKGPDSMRQRDSLGPLFSLFGDSTVLDVENENEEATRRHRVPLLSKLVVRSNRNELLLFNSSRTTRDP